jgi:hypothetical protein
MASHAPLNGRLRECASTTSHGRKRQLMRRVRMPGIFATRRMFELSRRGDQVRTSPSAQT